jgi:methyl-accepting chemotaxis protein
MGNKSNQRRNYYIDKEFQTRFILKFCGILLLGAVLTVGVLYILGLNSTTVAFVKSHVVAQNTATFITPLIIKTLVISGVLSLVLTVCVTLIVSHRISGPLYHINKVISGLSRGDFSKDIKLREKDQLHYVAESLNEMIQNNRFKIKAIKEQYCELENQVKELESSKDSKKLVKEIREQLQKVSEGISYFKI